MKKTFLLLFAVAVIAFGLLAGLATETSRGPDVSAGQTDRRTATAPAAEVVAVARTGAEAAKTAFNTKISPFDANYPGLKPEFARESRISDSSREIIETDVKYRVQMSPPKLTNYAAPEIAVFGGFGPGNNARAKI